MYNSVVSQPHNIISKYFVWWPCIELCSLCIYVKCRSFIELFNVVRSCIEYFNTDLSTDNTTLSAIGPISDSSQKDVTKDENSIPSYMLTPVSAIGTPTITLEGGDPNTTTTPIDLNFRRNQFSQGDGLSESPLPLGLHAGLRPGPSVRVTKIDTGGGGPHTLLQFLPDSLGSSSGGLAPSSSHPNKPQVCRDIHVHQYMYII